MLGFLALSTYYNDITFRFGIVRICLLLLYELDIQRCTWSIRIPNDRGQQNYQE